MERICIKNINMPFIDFRRHILYKEFLYTDFIETFEKFDSFYKK